MDISMVTVTIYFAGIAAVVSAPPQDLVSKSVIFPNAETSMSYQGTDLMPHHAYLNVRMQDFANPADCELYGGSGSGKNICSIPLSGARVWIQTSEPLIEEPSYRKIPMFLRQCPKDAQNLAAQYSGTEAEFVAGRFDMRGGTLSGCNRGQAYVVRLITKTNDGTLYVDQGNRLVRIVLKDNPVVAIENRPDPESSGQGEQHPHEMSHFGWYYYMNQQSTPPAARTTSCELIPLTNPVLEIADCPDNIPIELAAIAAMGSAECSVIATP